MYHDNKKIKIELEVEYEYDSEKEKIKEIIKQIIDLKNVKSLEVKEEK